MKYDNFWIRFLPLRVISVRLNHISDTLKFYCKSRDGLIEDEDTICFIHKEYQFSLWVKMFEILSESLPQVFLLWIFIMTELSKLSDLSEFSLSIGELLSLSISIFSISWRSLSHLMSKQYMVCFYDVPSVVLVKESFLFFYLFGDGFFAAVCLMCLSNIALSVLIYVCYIVIECLRAVYVPSIRRIVVLRILIATLIPVSAKLILLYPESCSQKWILLLGICLCICSYETETEGVEKGLFLPILLILTFFSILIYFVP